MQLKQAINALTVEGTTVQMFREQLDPAVFKELKTAVEKSIPGAKWKGGKTWGWVCDSDPRAALAALQAGGNIVKDQQFFWTPPIVAEELAAAVARAFPDQLLRDLDVLEPNAGLGHLAGVLVTELACYLDVCENHPPFVTALQNQGYNVVAEDFLRFNPFELWDDFAGYDAIVMNPPFNKGQYVDHVQHAYTMLKNGGFLAAIVPPSYTFSTRGADARFREWLDEVEGTLFCEWPAGTFDKTNIVTHQIHISK